MAEGILLLVEGLRQAGRRLGRLARGRLALQVVGGRLLSLAEVASSLGEAERDMCAVVVAIHGGMVEEPDLRFVMAVERAAVPALTGALASPALADDPRMGASVLQELGNIGATAIANHLAGHLGGQVRTSAPDVLEDRWGSLVAAVLASFADPADSVAILSTELDLDGRRFAGLACLITDREVALAGCLRGAGVKGV